MATLRQQWSGASGLTDEQLTEIWRKRNNPQSLAAFVDAIGAKTRSLVAKCSRFSGMDVEDLEAEAKVGLLSVLDRWDATCPIGAFFFKRIEWHLLAHMKECSSLVRLPESQYAKGERPRIHASLNCPISAEDDGISFLDALASPEDTSADDLLSQHEDIEIARRALGAIDNARRQEILRRLINGDERAAIAKDLGITPQAVSDHAFRGRVAFVQNYRRLQAQKQGESVEVIDQQELATRASQADVTNGDPALAQLTTTQLLDELARGLEITAQHLYRLGQIWLELERRGQDLSHLRRGLGYYLPLIGSGRVDARAVVNYAASPVVLRSVIAMPLEAQRRLLDAEAIEVVTTEGVTPVKPTCLSTAQISQVFAGDRIRTPDEQRELLRSRVATKRENARHALVEYNPKSRTLLLNRRLRVGITDVLDAIARATGQNAAELALKLGAVTP